VESGVTGGMPLLDRVRSWLGGMTTRGMIWAAIGGALVGAIGIALLMGRDANWGGLLVVAIVGLYLWRRFRNRGQRLATKFVKKASFVKEVRMITLHKGEFTIVADHPTAKTYLKLNALLTAANDSLYHGEPMTMVVREDLPEEEMRKLLSSPGVRFLREDSKLRKAAGRKG